MDGRITRFELDYAPPFDWPFFLRYLGARATLGVEAVDRDRYVRTFRVGTAAGILSLAHHPTAARLVAIIRGGADAEDQEILARVRRMFDFDVDLAAVHGKLGGDPCLGSLVAAAPGIRVPGAWTPFELLVRTIVGQQVTVKAATTIMGRIASRIGTPVVGVGLRSGAGEPAFLFPTASELAEGRLESIGLPTKRAVALQNVARVIADRTILFPEAAGDVVSATKLREALLDLPGIGPWTVEYFALRGLRDADAWPGTDLILRRSIEPYAVANLSSQSAVSEPWRPYRGYAAMHLWNKASQDQNLLKHKTT